MTLILNLATPHYVIQASDRRLTNIYTGELLDDETNKAVVFCNRASFAYTGLARIGNERTDVWLTKVLAKDNTLSLSQAFENLRIEATAAFQAIKFPPANKKHSFVCVGWTQLSSENFISPIVCRISNYYNRDNSQESEAKQEFEIHYQVLDPSRGNCFFSVGLQLTTREETDLIRILRRATQRSVGVETIKSFMIKSIRRAAKRSNTVGESILVTIIPKIALEDNNPWFIMSNSPHLPGQVTFQYFPKGSTTGVSYGPNYVCGGAALTDTKFGPL